MNNNERKDIISPKSFGRKYIFTVLAEADYLEITQKCRETGNKVSCVNIIKNENVTKYCIFCDREIYRLFIDKVL